jgi:hypothetical protein
VRALLTLLLTLVLAPSALAQGAPKTGFEQRDGAEFTTHEEEVAFLNAVAAGSPRVRLSVIGTTKQKRPMHLVELGEPGPTGPTEARKRPTALMVCSQHGNEPAGRETCLKLLRDLAFTADPALVSLLQTTTFLFVPTGNPDGRAANDRENSDAVDVNRDHLGLDSPEARAMARVVLDYAPDVAIDLHEYGPSMPVIYDDSVLWLWPRNLNTDKAVHDLAIEMGRKYLVPAANEKGYGTDEYGQAEVADNDVAQTAGDDDEGIMRNAMGLRHVLGILVETRVDADARQSALEPAEKARVQRRRVDSHYAVLQGMLRFMRERGAEAARVTADAAARKAAEGGIQNAPLYFDGADNAAPPADKVIDPPPCGYRLTAAQVAELGPRLELHGIEVFTGPSGPFVTMGQAAEPVIPLLLDERGSRAKSKATPVQSGCPTPPAGLQGSPGTPGAPGGNGNGNGAAPPAVAPLRPTTRGSARCVKRRTVTLKLPRRKGRTVFVRATAKGKRIRVSRGVAIVRLQKVKPGSRVRVRFVQRQRVGKKVRTFLASRDLRVCSA